MDDLKGFFEVVNRGPHLASLPKAIQLVMIDLLIEQVKRRAKLGGTKI